MGKSKKLNDQEVATILHALRIYQASLLNEASPCLAGACEHFDECARPTAGKIDNLCEKVNCDL